MNVSRPFHLPGLDAAALRPRPLAATGLLVPKLHLDHVNAQWTELDAAARRWRRRSVADRARVLADLEAWLLRLPETSRRPAQPAGAT